MTFICLCYDESHSITTFDVLCLISSISSYISKEDSRPALKHKACICSASAQFCSRAGIHSSRYHQSRFSSRTMFVSQESIQLWRSVYFAGFCIRYTLYIIHYTLYIIHYTLYIMHYALYIMHHILCIIHHTLCIIHRASCIIIIITINNNNY